MKAREYAISLGLAKDGRGRMSREAHEAIRAAIADGKTFSDYAVKETVKVTGGSVKTVKVEKVSREGEGSFIPREPVMTIREGASVTMEWNGKTRKVSPKEACGTCGYSLSYHICNNPLVVAPDGSGHVPVVIK